MEITKNDDSAKHTVITSVKLPRHRLRKASERLLSLRPRTKAAPAKPTQVVVVCISDSHNTQPDVPPGDLLLHAGDLTNDGSFDEIQAQLRWLSSQPHKHKVVIAGNHEVLLDDKFMAAHPERDYPSNGGRTRKDLDWGSVKYLNEESVSLDFANKSQSGTSRTIKVYGNPTTPRYGVSAFQEPRGEYDWHERVPSDTDILLVHGPPYKHLDGAFSSGCRDLAMEVERVRPALVVFGHIHVGRGQEEVVFDGLRKDYESIRASESGWITIGFMVLRLVYSWLVPARLASRTCPTKLVNAAVVGGEHHEYTHAAIVVEM